VKGGALLFLLLLLMSRKSEKKRKKKEMKGSWLFSVRLRWLDSFIGSFRLFYSCLIRVFWLGGGQRISSLSPFLYHLATRLSSSCPSLCFHGWPTILYLPSSY